LGGRYKFVSSQICWHIIYRHPRNDVRIFIEDLDANLQAINHENVKSLIFGDINIGLNSGIHHAPLSDYFFVLQSNAFTSLITKPTRELN